MTQDHLDVIRVAIARAAVDSLSNTMSGGLGEAKQNVCLVSLAKEMISAFSVIDAAEFPLQQTPQ